MNIEIITKNFDLGVYGFGGIATNKDYAETAFKLSGRMWEVVKANGLKNKGKNIWVYGDADKVFAGVELDNSFDDNNYFYFDKSKIVFVVKVKISELVVM
jgi:hypothetical protein